MALSYSDSHNAMEDVATIENLLSNNPDGLFKHSKDCFEFHILLLWQIIKADVVPQVPSHDVIVLFEHTYVKKQLEQIAELIPYTSYPHNTSVHGYVKKSIDEADPRNAEAINKIIISVIWEAKLPKWCPDASSGFLMSTYNLVHEELAIQLFKHLVLNTDAYRNLGVPSHYVKDDNILRLLFQSFVTSFFREAEALHSKIMDAKNESIAANYEEHVGSIVCLVPEKRNKKVTRYIRKLDKEILLCTLHLRGTHTYQGLLNVKQTRQKSLAFPSPDMALDWWDPEEFNKLPEAIRKLYASSPIALPLEEKIGESDWKDMKTGEFMTKYGNEVRALYNIPGEQGATTNWLEDAMRDSHDDVNMEVSEEDSAYTDNDHSEATPVNSDLGGEGDDDMDEYEESSVYENEEDQDMSDNDL
ncbi:hypothetical protein BT96DRAFT_933140 [Gymnopus androsaceus JB14]|uniref:Uncharacterized protein n=1 Tax=Gymnopus androsaceus JB14 TaxID=1447944 RepID=A0A6A4IGD9_9AGAR|nr:hypothetical protein BT96DRAFT_933140 [Gymnopus androsaceus JB14]